MIELTHTYGTEIIITLSSALVALTLVHLLRKERRKRIENELRAEIALLRQANQRLRELKEPDATEDSGIPQPQEEHKLQKLSARESLLLAQLNESIEQNYMDPDFGVDELAASLDMSRSSLNRKMRDSLKTTANNYIREVRIQKAEELLRTSSLQINEICYKVGFQTPSYFIKCFRKKYGKSPNEYANSSR